MKLEWIWDTGESDQVLGQCPMCKRDIEYTQQYKVLVFTYTNAEGSCIQICHKDCIKKEYGDDPRAEFENWHVIVFED